jgi:hypothetical protein
MRAKYINKAARRRSIRPDGDHYREMRKLRGDPRAIRNRAMTLTAMILGAAAIVWIIYAFVIR